MSLYLAEKLYTSKEPGSRMAAAKLALAGGTMPEKLWLIAMDTDGTHPLEIVRASELMQPYYPERPLLIAGFAESEGQAQQVLMKMVGEIVSATGSADPAAFYRGEWESGRAREIVC